MLVISLSMMTKLLTKLTLPTSWCCSGYVLPAPGPLVNLVGSLKLDLAVACILQQGLIASTEPFCGAAALMSDPVLTQPSSVPTWLHDSVLTHMAGSYVKAMCHLSCNAFGCLWCNSLSSLLQLSAVTSSAVSCGSPEVLLIIILHLHDYPL